MFRKVGPARTSGDDRRLAAYLSAIAGAVNSAGFIVIGTFTSHVTGNVGRLADEIAVGSESTALVAASTIAMFFVGAVVTSMAIESEVLGSTSRNSAGLLLLEAALIAAFIFVARFEPPWAVRVPMEPMLLSAAMGMQNALVTRLSRAVVRTTHLTGVVTDLGIETARWFRYYRARAGEARRVRLTITSTPASRPHPQKVALLATIFVAFLLGSAAGALLALRFSQWAFVPVVALLLAGAVYALWSGQSLVRGKRDAEP